ncbi:hypothetical protein Pint_12340 [Pistacia integerrima]|uniref:Uncharacterized protein n=1 Tax=Pistacia integerrima TaxID=434235 RepID=A0ACC0XJ33_9ROSI|nr:hypothetical protein Pint_12340 [Pistacia integerrima]
MKLRFSAMNYCGALFYFLFWKVKCFWESKLFDKFLQDFCEVCPDKLPNYEEKIKNFFEEHLHTDEEIRYCVAGSGYFDIRDRNDKWIRVWVKKGGMIVLPVGCYHRFTLDTNNYIKVPVLYISMQFQFVACVPADSTTFYLNTSPLIRKILSTLGI